jgi:hypothetical protein
VWFSDAAREDAKMRRSAGYVAVMAVLAVSIGCKSIKRQKPPVALNYVKPGQTVSHNASYIMNWQVLGPFSYEDKSYKEEWGSQEALDEKFVEDEANLQGGMEGTGLHGKKWKKYDPALSSSEGFVDLNALYEDPEYVVAYMSANLYCPEEIRECGLLFGSDDYIKVWLNGREIHTYKKERRPAEPDEDTVEGVVLDKGWNTLTIKCVDVVLGWGVYCRLVDDKGDPIAVLGNP